MTEKYDNNLTGVLFKNDRKEKETHPDYKGSCEIGGTDYWIAAWIKEGKKGKFMSLKMTAKDGPKQERSAPKRGGDGFDDIPW